MIHKHHIPLSTRLKTALKRRLFSSLKLHRPTSWPYIAGDSFRSLAQYALDESLDFDPKDVKNGDVIFVRTNYLREFAQSYQPKIQGKFILISHNEDMEVDIDVTDLVDFSKCQHWFAENLQVSHPKISPVPIGLANFQFHQNGEISAFDDLIFSSPATPAPIAALENSANATQNAREKFIFWDFAISSRPKVRLEAEKALETFPYSVHSHFDSQKEYYEYLKTVTHVASPCGRGEDCNRTWEALYLGASPIVVESVMTKHFKSIGIPLVIIKSWSEINSPAWIGHFKKSGGPLSALPSVDAFNPRDIDPLWMPYWANQIQIKRKSCFNQ